jgi:hypothetical protein
VDEADRQPLRDEPGLRGDHGLEQGEIAAFAGTIRIVACDHVVGEQAQGLHVAARREELEGADPDMAGGDAGQNGARQQYLPPDGLARQSCSKCTRRRNAERRHGLADDIFAQDRSQSGPAIAPTRKRGRACALQLEIVTLAAPIDQLAQQTGTPIAKLGVEAAELMAGIGGCDWSCAGRYVIAG